MIETMTNHPVAAQTRSSAVDKSPAGDNSVGHGLILGSASPRRAELLASLGLAFEVRAVEIDESALVNGDDVEPGSAVERIAVAKFVAFAPKPGDERTLLTADTLVACDGTVLGKPDSPGHVAVMLDAMSGCEVTIVTAVCVGRLGAAPATLVVTTQVLLRQIAAHEIERYAASRAGIDKAGGLALQAEARPFIERVYGCWANVVGLPLCAVTQLLGAAGSPSCSVERCGTHRG